jgi:hypothetical protein
VRVSDATLNTLTHFLISYGVTFQRFVTAMAGLMAIQDHRLPYSFKIAAILEHISRD